MRLIESKAEYIPQEEGLEGIYKQIELAGRTAYHSLDKITPDSAKDFVDRMIKSKHGAALEHGTVYLIGRFSSKKALFEDNWALKYIENPYTKAIRVPLDENNHYKGPQLLHVTTNYRVLIENGWEEDLKKSEDPDTVISYNPTDFHEKRYTMRFTCSRAIAQELTRHRVFSFLMESQRYINYSKGRHGGEITFIKPSWLNIPTGIVYWHDGICWRVQQDENNPMEWFSVIPRDGFSKEEAQITSTYFDSLSYAEKRYFFLLREKCQAQQARDILPNATKTELIMTGFSSDWRYLLDLRLFGKTGTPHPDMLNLMEKMRYEALEAGIWYDIMNKPSKFE